jgi:hypothetical protein
MVMLGFKQTLLQLSQNALKSSLGSNLFFNLSILSGIILIYLLFRNVKINEKERVGEP